MKSNKMEKVDSFTESEVHVLMEELPDDKVGHSIRVLLSTGLRVQELLALTKNDIADDGSLIHVNRAVKMVDGNAKFGSTKCELSTRSVPVPLEYRSSAQYLKLHSGESYIWCSDCDNLLDERAFRSAYYRALKGVGVRLLPPQCCRHTYVSRLEKKGVPMEQITRLVGYNRNATTNGYLHIKMESLQAAANVLNTAAINNSTKGESHDYEVQ